MLNLLSTISRFNKQLIMIFSDSILIVLVILASFSVRLGELYFPKHDLILALLLLSPLIAIPIFYKFGLYRLVIRYIEFKALWTVVKAVTFYSLIWGILGMMIMVELEYYILPRSVVLINWMLSILVIGGIRLLAKFILSNSLELNRKTQTNYKNNKYKVLVYGAGDAGIQLVSALENLREYNLIGFIDDSKELQGNQIKGLYVYSIDELKSVVEKFKVDEVLLALPNLSHSSRLTIIEKIEPYPVKVRILPGLTELVQGKVSINDLRAVNINDLLGRDVIGPKEALLGKNIRNRTVLVTGAGGSIGSELCRQLLKLKPKALILLEISELALYSIDQELSKSEKNKISIYPLLGSVKNKERLENIFKSFEVDTIFHAAAYKHVPIVEFNISEGIENNIFGTLNCAQAAINSNVKTFVLVSTDKAVRPTNIMGASKRAAEMILQAISEQQAKTKFTMVRFGNVLGSSGSVIPLFRRQIETGGPVTVTNKDVIRYFMTIPESVELVIQAGAMGQGGDVFVLDMGKPVRIKDLAEKMIRLSGLEVKNKSNPKGDIEIKYTGLRAGEKLFEELLIGNNVQKTSHPLIMSAKEDMLSWPELERLLENLRNAVKSSDQEKIRIVLMQIVPGFKPYPKISDIIHNVK
jgi:FlaA1/EpsC-like NDP-sugar epimerase